MINLCTVTTIQKYSKWNFLKFSAISAFSFLGLGLQTKTRNWRKIKFESFLTGENLWKGIRVSLGIILRLYYQRRKEIMIFRWFRGFREFLGINLASSFSWIENYKLINTHSPHQLEQEEVRQWSQIDCKYLVNIQTNN